jgi:hypothetical protein
MPTPSQNSAALATSDGFTASRLAPRIVLTPGACEAAVAPAGPSVSISSSSSSSTSTTSSPSTSSSSEAAG